MGVKFQDPSDWTTMSNLMAHEFGHALGATLHDDQFYDVARANSLIMWSEVKCKSKFRYLVLLSIAVHFCPK